MTTRIRLCILLVLVALAKLGAQPDVTLYWNPVDRADTVMDFGVTLEGLPTFRNFTVENNSPFTVAIFETRPDAEPYYLIVNIPSVPPEDPRKEEFERVDRLPYFVPAGTSRSFTVTFRAIANNPLFPPDRVAEALLQLRVADSAQPLAATTNKTFLLRALKTTKILASTTPWLRYDSVYVQPAPSAPSINYVVENAIDKRVVVDRQLLEMKTAVVGPLEIQVDTFPVVSFAPQQPVTWTTRYSPYNRGKDSANFLVVYRPDPTSRPDTVVAAISGIGVEQRLSLVSSTGNVQPVVIRGDTIDFGSVPAGGAGVTTRIIVRNEGNCNIGVDREQKVGAVQDTAAFIITRSLLTGGPTIRTNAFDTIDLTFAPSSGGDHRMRLDIHTDLRSRTIAGVPDGAQTTSWIVIGFAQRPQLQVTPSEISFGSVVLLPTCTSTSERTITVRNLGNAELRVDSIIVSPTTARILVSPPSFRLAPAETQIVRCIYEATTVGVDQGALTMHTNSLIRAYDVAWSANVVRPDTTVVVLAARTTARPGTVVAFPVGVTPEAVSRTDRATLGLTYNASLLRYRGISQQATASEGARIVSVGELSPGNLRVSVEAPANFLPIETFITVLFDSYLGGQASTDVSVLVGETTFGNAGCASALVVAPSNGVFELDSLCGLEYKTVLNRSASAAAVFPNPAENAATVVVQLAKSEDVAVRVISGLGETLLSVQTPSLAQGTSLLPLDLSTLSPGSYTIVVQCGRRFHSVPLAVQR